MLKVEEVEEVFGLLQVQRPDDRGEYRIQNDGVHFAFKDARRRRFVFVIGRDLMEGRSPKDIVNWLDLHNWLLVTGALRGKHVPIFTEHGVE